MQLRQGIAFWLPVFWETQSCTTLATEPDPGVNEPECHSSRIQDHLTLGPFFVFFLQQMQTPVQLHNLKDHMNTIPFLPQLFKMVRTSFVPSLGMIFKSTHKFYMYSIRFLKFKLCKCRDQIKFKNSPGIIHLNELTKEVGKIIPV